MKCRTWIKETGHSKITLLLQLNYVLQNSSLIVKHAEVGCPRGGQPHTGCMRYGPRSNTKRLPIDAASLRMDAGPKPQGIFFSLFLF